MDIESGITALASSVGGSGSMTMPVNDHASTSRVNSLILGGAEDDHSMSSGLVALPDFVSAAASSAVSGDLPGLAAALAGPALSAESLQRAREIAERRLRGVRRLMEENLREDLELQARFLNISFLRFAVCS